MRFSCISSTASAGPFRCCGTANGYGSPRQQKPPGPSTFPAPFGTIQAPVIGHPEPIMLPRHIPGIESITVRGAVYPGVLQDTIQTLAGLGLLSDRPVSLRGTSITPREFILACFETHLETPEMRAEIESATASLPSPVYGSPAHRCGRGARRSPRSVPIHHRRPIFAMPRTGRRPSAPRWWPPGKSASRVCYAPSSASTLCGSSLSWKNGGFGL